jgi:hypothetical protein
MPLHTLMCCLTFFSARPLVHELLGSNVIHPDIVTTTIINTTTIIVTTSSHHHNIIATSFLATSLF